MAAHSLTIVHHMLQYIHTYETADVASGQNAIHMMKIAMNAPGWDSTLGLELPYEHSFCKLFDAIEDRRIDDAKVILEAMKVAFEPSHKWFGSMEDVKCGMQDFVRFSIPHYKKREKDFWAGNFPHGDEMKAPFYKKELTSV